MDAIVTTERRASDKVHDVVEDLVERNPDHALDYLWYFNAWKVPEVIKEMEEGVPSAIKSLDNTMKGWTPVANGTETHYGVSGNYLNLVYWYQRRYTK